jgi:hypothetical protein
MKTISLVKAAAFASVIFLSSCKKETGKADDNNTNSNPTIPAITLLKSNDWKVAVSLTREKHQGVLGGAFQTAALDLQKQDELRWYMWFQDMSSVSDATEIVLDKQGKTTTNKPATSGATDYRQIKTIYGGNTWETHIPWYSGYNIAVFKNNQGINIKLDANATKIKNIVASEDGLLNNSEVSGGSNSVSHYHYGTGAWKTNTFWAWKFVSVRYNNRTYVISVSKNTNQDGITVLSETDNQQTSLQGQVYYEMKSENHLAFAPVGFLIHSAQYGENVYIALDAYANKFEVYKINLANFTIQRVLNETKAVVYSQMANEIDSAGNLYIVERRSENNKSFFSIRKYAVSGGNEVVLKETDLLPYTWVHALKFFAGRLHAAVMYKQDVPDGNPNDNSFTYKYHLQLIAPK